MYVTEFQKRGLSHVHMLLILENNDKLCIPEEYDAIVRAEIPYFEEEPQIHHTILNHRIHRHCDIINPNTPCMKDGRCKKYSLKTFQLKHTRNERRSDELVTLNRRVTIDNRWVVPYNPWFLLKYDCHINVEVCSSIKRITYLYKYVYKGLDRVAMEVHRVVRLQIHLPNRQQIWFYDHQIINNILNDDHNSKTMLTQLFALNHLEVEARYYLYTKIPKKKYTWDKDNREWHRRRNRRWVLRRMYTVSPSEGDKFYLCVFLNHVRGPTSWEDLLTVDGTCVPTFKQSDKERASNLRTPIALRRLFVTILVFCESTDVRSLWEDSIAETNFTNKLIRYVNDILLLHGKQISYFDLPTLPLNDPKDNVTRRIIQEQLGIGKTFLYRALCSKLRSIEKIVLATAASRIATTLLPRGQTAHSRFKIPLNLDSSSVCSIRKQPDLVKIITRAS
ncbi:hypothetical protein Lal_00039684 [Lupinus albus]|nr:hypothetical protein Lal_00039684 [Lupinus albus]